MTLMRNLDPDRYVPRLVTSGRGLLTKAASKYGIETTVQTFPCFSRRKPWVYFWSIYNFARMVAQKNVSLIHTNDPGAASQVMWVSKWKGVPYVAHVRDYRHAWSAPNQVRFLHQARFVIANSKAISRYFIGLGVPSSHIRVVYNPVDVAVYSQPVCLEQKKGFRAMFEIPNEALLIGIIGQVQEIKGQQDLIMAAPEILKRFPGTHFLIAGSTFDEKACEYERHLRRLILKLRLTDRFHLVGFQEDVRLVLQTMDVLVVPSWCEPFGRVVVEGMAAGCPVIGTNKGGIPEIIDNGVNGLLIQPQNPAEIARSVTLLAENVVLKSKFISRGRVTAKRFNVSAHVNAVQTLYNTVLESSGSG